MLLMTGVGTPRVRGSEPGDDTRYRFRHITNQNGLKYSWIWNIDQDSQGYLWFSTMYGTYRYDGYEFEEYAFRNHRNGTVANVNFVQEEHSGTLWFGTDDGLYRHDRRYNTHVRYAASEESPCRLSSDVILCMTESADGTLWVGTANGVNRIAPNRRENSILPQPDGGYPSVTAICCREDGTVWCGDNGGKLWRMAGQERPVEVLLEGSRHAVKALCEDASGSLWVATEGSGLYRIDSTGAVRRYTEERGTLSNDIVRALSLDREGYLWVGTERGITILADETPTFIYSRGDDN